MKVTDADVLLALEEVGMCCQRYTLIAKKLSIAKGEKISKQAIHSRFKKWERQGLMAIYGYRTVSLRVIR